jgi:hypothetical protein
MTFLNPEPLNLSVNFKIHLKPDSPYKNAGKDGTNIGIYGDVCTHGRKVPYHPIPIFKRST